MSRAMHQIEQIRYRHRDKVGLGSGPASGYGLEWSTMRHPGRCMLMIDPAARILGTTRGDSRVFR